MRLEEGKNMGKKRKGNRASNNASSNRNFSQTARGSSETEGESSCPHVYKGVRLSNLNNILPHKTLKECEKCEDNTPSQEKAERNAQVVHQHDENTAQSSDEQGVCMCLKCGHQGCDRSSSIQHALKHFQSNAAHPITLHLDHWIVWCYICDTELQADHHPEVASCVNIIRRTLGVKATATVDEGFGGVAVSGKSGEVARVKGLSNLGNTCFFNSVMQNLVHSCSMLKYMSAAIGVNQRVVTIKPKKLAQLDVTVTDSPGQLTTELLGFLKEMSGTENRNVVSPRKLFQEISRKATRFRGFQQQDSQELLRYLLDGVRSEELRRIKVGVLKAHSIGDKHTVGDLPKNTKEAIKEYGRCLDISRDNTFIDEMFCGQWVSTVLCLTCHKASQVFESFLDVSLPVINFRQTVIQTKGEIKKGKVAEKGGRHDQDVGDTSSAPKKDPPMSKHQRKKAAREIKKSKKKGNAHHSKNDAHTTEDIEQNEEEDVVCNLENTFNSLEIHEQNTYQETQVLDSKSASLDEPGKPSCESSNNPLINSCTTCDNSATEQEDYDSGVASLTCSSDSVNSSSTSGSPSQSQISSNMCRSVDECKDNFTELGESVTENTMNVSNICESLDESKGALNKGEVNVTRDVEPLTNSESGPSSCVKELHGQSQKTVNLSNICGPLDESKEALNEGEVIVSEDSEPLTSSESGTTIGSNKSCDQSHTTLNVSIVCEPLVESKVALNEGEVNVTEDSEPLTSSELGTSLNSTSHDQLENVSNSSNACESLSDNNELLIQRKGAVTKENKLLIQSENMLNGDIAVETVESVTPLSDTGSFTSTRETIDQSQTIPSTSEVCETVDENKEPLHREAENVELISQVGSSTNSSESMVQPPISDSTNTHRSNNGCDAIQRDVSNTGQNHSAENGSSSHAEINDNQTNSSSQETIYSKEGMAIRTANSTSGTDEITDNLSRVSIDQVTDADRIANEDVMTQEPGNESNISNQRDQACEGQKHKSMDHTVTELEDISNITSAVKNTCPLEDGLDACDQNNDETKARTNVDTQCQYSAGSHEEDEATSSSDNVVMLGSGVSGDMCHAAGSIMTGVVKGSGDEVPAELSVPGEKTVTACFTDSAISLDIHPFECSTETSTCKTVNQNTADGADESSGDVDEEDNMRNTKNGGSVGFPYVPSPGECSVMSLLAHFCTEELLTGKNQFGCSNCTDKENKNTSGNNSQEDEDSGSSSDDECRGAKATKPKGSSVNKKVYSDASKKIQFYKLPPILTFHIKRFDNVGARLKKNNQFVEFPSLLDMAPFCAENDQVSFKAQQYLYTLCGLVEHSGSLHSGHYISYVKCRKTTQWSYISDSRVTPVQESQVHRAQAYLLFYQRIDSL